MIALLWNDKPTHHAFSPVGIGSPICSQCMNVTCFSEAKAGGVNEDAVESAQHPQNNAAWIIALADGQGGRTGGAEAAQLAVRAAIQTASSAPVQQLLSERFWTKP